MDLERPTPETSSAATVAASGDLSVARRVLADEAQALLRLGAELDETFAQATDYLFRCVGAVVVTGMGKSGLVGRKWSATFSSTGTRSYFLNPAEANHGDLGVLRPGDVLVALSSSGETDELSLVLRYAREAAIPVIAVTRVAGSSLGRQATVVLPLPDVPEACPLGLAPTTSTTMTLALGDALASALMVRRGFTERDFARVHPGGSLGRRLWLRVEELMHRGDEIPRVRPDASFEDVLLAMTSKRLGLAVVVEGTGNDVVCGVVTDGDLRRFLQRQPDLAKAKAQEMMTVTPQRLAKGSLAIEARETMERLRIQHLLVIDENERLAGVLHFHDLLRRKVV